MLARMFNGQLDSATDAHGRVFIDRDGSLFATVLEYLRNADYELPDSITKGQLQALRREADFFSLVASALLLQARWQFLTLLLLQLLTLPQLRHLLQMQPLLPLLKLLLMLLPLWQRGWLLSAKSNL
jgi:BTB/POZ domain